MKNLLLSPPYLSVDNLSFLKKCMKAKALRPCKQIHALLLASGVDMNPDSINSKLIAMYASCGDLNSAKLIFQKTQNPNVFALNWMISASAFNGYYEEAIGYFSFLQKSKNLPNGYTFSVVLKACVGLMDVEKEKEIHAMICKMGFESDEAIGNGLIDMSCKCGNVSNARKVFDEMSMRGVAF